MDNLNRTRKDALLRGKKNEKKCDVEATIQKSENKLQLSLEDISCCKEEYILIDTKNEKLTAPRWCLSNLIVWQILDKTKIVGTSSAKNPQTNKKKKRKRKTIKIKWILTESIPLFVVSWSMSFKYFSTWQNQLQVFCLCYASVGSVIQSVYIYIYIYIYIHTYIYIYIYIHAHCGLRSLVGKFADCRIS